MRPVRPSSAHVRRRALAAGALVATSLFVAGCTSEEPAEPETSTTTTAEAEPTETPEPTPAETGPAKPERPAAMEQEDAEGAAAAAEYYMSLYGYMLKSGDVAEWAAMSDETCGFCSATLEKVAWLEESGATYESGEASLVVEDPQRYVRDEDTGIFPLDALLAQDSVVVTAADGSQVANEAAYEEQVRVEMGRAEGSWTVVEIAPVPEG